MGALQEMRRERGWRECCTSEQLKARAGALQHLVEGQNHGITQQRVRRGTDALLNGIAVHHLWAAQLRGHRGADGFEQRSAIVQWARHRVRLDAGRLQKARRAATAQRDFREW